MKTRPTKIFVILIALAVALSACGAFRPAIPSHDIPADTPDEVRALIEQLYSYRAYRRAEAAVMLGELGIDAKAAVPFLADRLNDHRTVPITVDDEETRSYVSSEAAWALGEIGDPHAVTHLFNAIISDEQEVAVQAETDAIISIGDPAVLPLAVILSDDDLDRRLLAVELLSKIGSKKSIDSLFSAQKNSEVKVRIAATKKLTLLDTPRAVSALIIALSDKHYYTVRLYAVKALYDFSDARVVPSLISALKDDYFTVRLSAAESLGKIKDNRATLPLIELLDDNYEKIREQAMESLGEIGDERAILPLLDTINYKGFLIQNEAIDALKKIGDASVMPLLAVLKGEDTHAARAPVQNKFGAGDNNWHTKTNAARALGSIMNPLAVEPLINLLNDPEEEVRMNAIWALGRIRDHRAVEPLIKTLTDDSADIRASAILVLGKIKDERAIKPLIKALDDKDSDVQTNAAWALGKITHENFRFDKSEWEAWLKEKEGSL